MGLENAFVGFCILSCFSRKKKLVTQRLYFFFKPQNSIGISFKKWHQLGVVVYSLLCPLFIKWPSEERREKNNVKKHF